MATIRRFETLALAFTLIQVLTPGTVIASVIETRLEFESSFLPKDVHPMHYDLDLDFFDASDSTHYQGNVTIDVKVSPDVSERRSSLSAFLGCLRPRVVEGCANKASNKNRIMLNAHKDIRFLSISYIKILANGRSDKKIEVLGIERDNAKDLLAIYLSHNLRGDSRGIFLIAFEAPYREDLRGVYKQHYGYPFEYKRYRYIASSFEPADARLAFPCFDEPWYKSTFSLTLIHRDLETPVSNAPIMGREVKRLPKSRTELIVTTFERTELMPVHMLGFAIWKFKFIERKGVGKGSIPVRIYTDSGLEEKGRYALNVACKAIEFMERYTEVEYPLKKFDIVVLPDRDKDNTGSWGIAQLRSDVALFDNETSADFTITIAINVAHVVAHQWFGNLITADWWDDLWITESIAAQSTFEFVRELIPESEFFMRMEILFDVLQNDAHVVEGLHPLAPPSWRLQSSSQIREIFDNLEFVKSGSLAQLMQNKLGYEKFREVWVRLIKKHAYGNIARMDFATEIEIATGERSFLSKFVTQLKSSSYPVVNIDIDQENRLKLNFGGIQPNELGLSFEFGDAHGKRARVGFDISNSSIRTPQWFDVGNPENFVKVNPKPDISTYFRVKYSDTILESNMKIAIEQRLLSPLDRLHVLDDTIGLVLSGHVQLALLKKMLYHYRGENHGAVILGVVAASKVILKLDKAEQKPKQFVLEILLNIYERFGFEAPTRSSPLEKRAHTMTLNLLVTLSNEQVISEALRRFDSSDGFVTEPYLREPIYKVVVAHGNEMQVAKLVLHMHETSSAQELIRLIRALTNVNKVKVLLDTYNRTRWDSNLSTDTKRKLIVAMRQTHLGRQHLDKIYY